MNIDLEIDKAINDFIEYEKDTIPKWMAPLFSDKLSSQVQRLNSGGQAWESEFDRNPNEHDETTKISTGIVYDTSTGLPVVELSEYPVDEQEQTARNNSMFDINSMNNAAIASNFSNAIFSETNVLGLPNLPVPTPIGMFNFLATKDTQIVARNAFYSKSIDDQIDIMSRIDEKNEFGLKNVYDPKIREGILEIALPMTEAQASQQQVNQVPYPSQAYTTQPNVSSVANKPFNIEAIKNTLDNIAESKAMQAASKAMQAREQKDMEQVQPEEVAIGIQIAKELAPQIDRISSSEAMQAKEQQYMDKVQQADMAAKDIALNIDVGPMAGIDVGASGGSGSGGGTGGESGPSGGGHGGLNRGGPVNMQLGGETENADTNMEVANVPMGVVSDRDGAPGPFRGGTGVEDDLDMEVEAGSYVLNAESVQLVGISDINAVIRDAYTIAAKLGKPLPEDYDPQNKVPIRISNGEAVIPKSLVDIIGLDKLEKWNQKGLQLRKQKEKMQAQQQQAQPPQQQQVASEAPPVQPQSPMQAQMGGLMGYNEGDTVLDPETATSEEMEALFRGVPEGIGSDINKGITVEKTSQPKNTNLNKYNIIYGHNKYRNLLPEGREITDMTIREVYNLQDALREATQNESLTTTAVGGSQFLQETLKDLLSRNKNITEDMLFTPDLQNQLTEQIFKEEKVYNLGLLPYP